MTARLRWLAFACVTSIVTSLATSGRAADNFDCGPGGVPDPKTSRCTCPPGKIEKTVGGISRCVAKPPPVVTPKPPTPPKPPLPSCTSSQVPSDGGCIDKCAPDEVFRDGLCIARCPKTATWDGATCVAKDEPTPPTVIGEPSPSPTTATPSTPLPSVPPPVATSASDEVVTAPPPLIITDSVRRWGPQRLDFGIPFAIVLGYTSARRDVTYGGGGASSSYHFGGIPLMLGVALTAGPYRALDVGCASTSCSSPATGHGTAILFEVTAAFAPFSVPHALESPVSLLNPFVGPTFAAYDFSRKDADLQKPANGVALLLSAGNSFLFRFLQKDDGYGVFFGVTPAFAAGIAGSGAMPTARATMTFSATLVGP